MGQDRGCRLSSGNGFCPKLRQQDSREAGPVGRQVVVIQTAAWAKGVYGLGDQGLRLLALR